MKMERANRHKLATINLARLKGGFFRGLLIVFAAVGLMVPISGRAQDKPVFLSWQAAKDETPMADTNSVFWSSITGVVMDKSVLGPEMPRFQAEVRSRWTSNNVYFLFIGHYEKLTLRVNPDTTNETFRLWDKDCFELYLGADFEHINRYREFQMSPQGEFLDLDIDSRKAASGLQRRTEMELGFHGAGAD